MALLVGVVLALGVGAFGTVSGFDRDRAFYATTMIVIAALYSLFAVIGGSTQALLIDGAIGLGFIVLTVAGFRGSMWLVALALAAHGAMDIVHHRLVTNPGVPAWWPAFCGAYDIVAAGYLAWLLRSGRLRVRR